ncbi:peptide/nickel transport system substrate-binding protein [Thalassococcus halodurans]|uniref:Peptide/nickel transport system substrate-binding protein n=1 Tax=Thalassococcus halodurans TaxID=373675 RepID=A0A1H5SYV6_9RHOB|nr:ABC transporter substrate-binding protein [Thalassococcus halodurans]SEF55763.1 peptide/nickel transport system substrate-binding protein [Thalassococcus halodurans]
MNLKACLKGTALAMVVALPAMAQDNAVTVVLSEELDLVDPCMSSRSNIGRVVLQNIAETITEMVPGQGLQPRLATEWEDMGGGTWRFHLRDGVTFHDGSAFDAEDVAHSIARTTGDKIVCEIGAKYFGGMELTTNVVDANTIDITADPAQPILPLLMSTMTVVPAETAVDSFVSTPVGTGPYTFDEYNVGQNIKLSANPNYWGDQPAVQSANYVFRSDSAVRAAMVQTGEADIAPNIALQDATNDAMDYSYPNSETVYLRVDHNIAPLNDVRVRKALNLAVDREAFVGTILANGTLLATGMTPPSTIGYNTDLTHYAYDPEQAKALLAEAKADGVDVDQEITLIGRTGNFGNVLETMEALTAMFQDAGFNMKLEMYEVAEWENFYSKPFAEDRGPQMVQAQHDNANGDPVFSMYFKYACDGLQSGVCDEKIDSMIADATASVGAEREAKWKDLFAYIHEENVTDVFLFHMVGFSRVGERLDFEPTIKTNSELQLAQISFK